MIGGRTKQGIKDKCSMIENNTVQRAHPLDHVKRNKINHNLFEISKCKSSFLLACGLRMESRLGAFIEWIKNNFFFSHSSNLLLCVKNNKINNHQAKVAEVSC